MKIFKSPLFFPLVMATLAMCGFFILVLSPQDIGAGPDSFAYISAARSFLAGEGFKSVTWDGDFEVMTHFPPFYSFLVAEFSFGKLDLLQSAKWLNAFILFANIFMIGLIIRQLTEHEWLALFGAAIFLTSQLTLLTHSNAWTEPLFMAFAFAAIGLLGLYTKEKRRVWLLLAAIMVGLGAITRYVGVTLIGTTMLLLLLYPYAEKRKRVYDTLIFTAVSLTPLTLWLIRNSLVANSVTNRTLAFHPVQRSAILTAIYTFGLWVLPGIQTTLVTGLLFVCLIGLVFILQFRLNRSIPVILIWCGLFILVYCGFLIASITFVDAHTPLDIRILFPVYAVSLICILGGLANLMPRLKAIPFVRVLPLGVCLAYLVLNMIAGSQMLNTIYNNGQGYTSQSWHQSELMSQAFLLSENATLYSNVPDAIYFVRDAVVQGIPLKAFATSLQKNDSYTIEFEAMVEDMHVNQAKIVYFNRVSRWYLPTQAELARNPSFSILFENKEGMIYEYDRSVP